MAKMHVRTGSVWKGVNKLHVRVGGTWKQVLNGYVRVNGSWKKFHSASPVELPASFTADDFSFGTDSYAGIQFNSNGLIYRVQGDTLSWSSVDTWRNSGASSDYQVRVDRLTQYSNSGDSFTGSSEGVWHTLSTTRSYYFDSIGIDNKHAYIQVQIRMAASPNTVLADSGTGQTYWIHAEAEE